MERDTEREAEREWERALAGEGERDLDLDLDLDLALDLESSSEREREREPRSGSPASSSLLGGSRPLDTDFLERSLMPDLERDLERERDRDLESSFLLFLPSFLLFLLLGLRLRLLSFWAPLLRSSSSFLPLPLLFLLWDLLREREAALSLPRRVDGSSFVTLKHLHQGINNGLRNLNDYVQVISNKFTTF